jgi:hypothetical protein
MSSAKLTIVGLYQYDNTLFDGMVLPEGIDKDLLIDNIIMKGGEYEVQYPDLDVLKHLIGSWSRQWYDTFYNWLRATDEMKQIAPLDNYNRHEEWGDNTDVSASASSTSQDTMNGSGSTSGSDTSHGTGTVTNNTTDTSKISADDSTDFVNKTQDVSDNSQGNVTDTSATTSTTSQTNTTSNATSSSQNTSNTSSDHTGHIWGNIGVTTSATMFAEFYDVLNRYGNIYDSIAIVFCQSFVIPITL